VLGVLHMTAPAGSFAAAFRAVPLLLVRNDNPRHLRHQRAGAWPANKGAPSTQDAYKLPVLLLLL